MIKMKVWAAALAALLILFSACAAADRQERTGDTEPLLLKENVDLQRVVAQMDAQFPGGAVQWPEAITTTILRDKFGLEPEDVVDFGGEISANPEYSDCLLAIEAHDGGAANMIAEMLQSYNNEQAALFSRTNPSGSAQRLESARVVTRGNYVFYVCLGVVDDETGDMGHFADDVRRAVTVVEQSFA